jgi:hypothetical protein
MSDESINSVVNRNRWGRQLLTRVKCLHREEGREPIHHLAARPPLARKHRRPSAVISAAAAPPRGAEVLGDHVEHVTQAPLGADDGEVGPAGRVVEVVVHDAAATLLRHELLPPPHELRAVLPRHPRPQRQHRQGRTPTPSPGHGTMRVEAPPPTASSCPCREVAGKKAPR